MKYPQSLSYDDIPNPITDVRNIQEGKEGVDRTGLEPATPALQMRCSTR